MTTRRLVPYAGFDPLEDYYPQNGVSINVQRALEIRATFQITWDKVGVILAMEQNRTTPYRGHSIRTAVRRGR